MFKKNEIKSAEPSPYNFEYMNPVSGNPGSVVLQRTHHIVTHTGPHKVTSSNIYQIKAKSLPNQKMHDATSVCRGVNFYESLKKGTHTSK